MPDALSPSSPAASRVLIWGSSLLIIGAGLAAYHRTLTVPFLLDDSSSILNNATIRHLWPLTEVLRPPSGGLTVEGRPVLNLSLALNYAVNGPRVTGYHVFNVVIHLLAALTLFGIVRRTLVLASEAGRGRPRLAIFLPGNKASVADDITRLAALVALLWAIHPLQTESVTYLVQRAESLAGFFFLLTLYTFIRGTQSARGGGWFAVSFAACLLGMGTKETMVAAPVVVFLYDYTFSSISGFEVGRRRWKYYFALAATWILLAVLVRAAGDRGGTIGQPAGVAWWEYGLTQSRALVHYLALSIWPSPLIFDYGEDFVRPPWAAVPYLCFDGALLIVTAIGLWQRRALALAGACFFAVLAPTSSVVGGTRQMLSEHRMYLALAIVLVVGLLGLVRSLGRRAFWVGGFIAVALGWSAAARNEVYQSALGLWSDTVRKRPQNIWAQNNLGTELLVLNRPADAAEHFAEAVRLRPEFAEGQNNFGNALMRLGRPDEALSHYERALQVRPDFAEAQNDLGDALASLGRPSEAMLHFERAMQLKPQDPEALNNLANVLAQLGRFPEAIGHYTRAIQLDPGYAVPHNGLANVWAQQGQLANANAHYAEALRLRPDYAEAAFNWANALASAGQNSEALARYTKAIQIAPAYAEARNNLGNLLNQIGRAGEAVTQLQEAVHLKPASAAFHYNLGNALVNAGRADDAVREYREALRLEPGLNAAQQALARLQARP